MGVRDEKPLTAALSTLVHIVCVNTAAVGLSEGQTPAIRLMELYGSVRED